jgi:hypothetical protein
MGIRKSIVDFLIVLLGSILAGFAIGTIQHYVAFGVWEKGLELENFELALFEGGILGAIFGVPTGLVTFYFVLRKAVNFKRAAFIVLGSLLCGAGSAVIIFWLSAFVTPFATLGLALIARKIE